ncbi:MAG TPA: alcohol dehydrogenase catalytic domain-containing protein, partial [Chthoniobacterales bacterium]|nr:alcohol dehydrogenase catalytic domain-containing protein [Chthoniobacterales bacterium]
MQTETGADVLQEIPIKSGTRSRTNARRTMRANVFHGRNDIRVEEVPRPRAGVGEAVIRITLTTICGTDLHILRGEYVVKP